MHNTILRVLTPDKTAYEMRQNTQHNYVDPFTLDISPDVKRLSNFIESINK